MRGEEAKQRYARGGTHSGVARSDFFAGHHFEHIFTLPLPFSTKF